MWQKVAKFKGAEYFRKALYMGWQGSLVVSAEGCKIEYPS